MLNDIKNIKKCVEKESDQEQLTVDLNKVSFQLCKVLNDEDKVKVKKEKLHEKHVEFKNGLPLSVATFGINSMSSIDNSDSSPNSSKIISKESSLLNENYLGGKHSRYINKNTDCYTIQNTYTNMKELEQKAKIYDNPYNNGRTSSTSSNNSSSNTSGILTNFTNSNTCLFKNENLNQANFKVTDEYLNNYYIETPKSSKLNKNNNNNPYLTNMLQNYPKKSTITNKLFDYQNNATTTSNMHENTQSMIHNSSTTSSTSSESISKIDERKKKEEKRQLKLLNALLKSPSKNSYV